MKRLTIRLIKLQMGVNMDEKFVLTTILGEKYYDLDDLRYNKEAGFLFSREQINEFLRAKDKFIDEGNKNFVKLPLKTFNSKHCFYVDGAYLSNTNNEYLSVLIDDFEENKVFLFDRNKSDIMQSRIFSEVEGTLRVENVPTTQKRIKEIFSDANPTEKNDIIIKNMQNALDFIITEEPSFNKDNLLKLYNLLSDNCLEEENKLKKKHYYRDDSVSVGGYDGADAKDVDEMMDSLFAFVNDPDSVKRYRVLLPLICHYYIVYVHPYFDYNGRTARMVSFWISYIFKIETAPFFISEAINEDKTNYYKAISNTRNTNNDLTYFLGYILENAIKFSLIYKNVEEIKSKLVLTGDFLTSAEQNYLKKIIIHNSTGYFNHKMFLQYINAEMSVPGRTKILNRLAGYNVLIKDVNKKGETIYKINQDMLKYKF